MRATIFTLLLTAPPVFATSYTQPKRHEVFSHNPAFVLDVNPETRTHTVYDVRDRGKSLWSFSCGVWHFPFLLSDGGQVAATVGWEHVQEQDIAEADAVTFWNKDGKFRTHALRDVCPDPPRTQNVGGGPIGAFWRTWYTEVEDHGDSFTIRTTVGVAYRRLPGAPCPRAPTSNATISRGPGRGSNLKSNTLINKGVALDRVGRAVF